ncbi:MAG: esterase-like activity of phytase family protein [Alphaproteobacteria bacterium]|nr:esterase-like activity of phytase family protein [Alphaproteobacteria bacterium]
MIFRALAVAILLLAAAPAWSATIEVRAEPVLLNEKDPAETTVGKLRYRGGVVLKSSDHRFGGFSGLAVAADGGYLIAVSDHGLRLSTKIVYGADGNLAGLAEADLGALAGEDGRPLRSNAERDAEALAAGPSGEVVVAFERDHRLLRYLPGQQVPERLPSPEELAAAPANGGIEGLTFLEDGRLFAIAEELIRGDRAVGWVSDADGWSPLTYALSDGFVVTDLARLPSGDVLALERRYTMRIGVAARVRRIAKDAIAPGAELAGELIAELRPPLTVDNMEGISARRDSGTGKTLVYLISDDNFSAAQRTLLMMFELME